MPVKAIYPRGGFSRMRMLRPTRIRLEPGFSLLEVLITVVVISIGLLGLAGLQFAGLRASNSAQDHTRATLLAQDIAERIHANPGSGYNGINLDSASSVTPVSCDAGSDCDSSTLRRYDEYQWKQAIDRPLLANLQLKIEHFGADPDDFYTVTINWGNADNQQSLIASFAP
jgi:type IV pilus assembly protein PilV